MGLFLLFSELFSHFHAPWNLSCYLVEVAQPPWRNVFSREKKREPSVFPLPFPYSLQFVSPKSFNRQLSNIVCPIPASKRKQGNHPISPKEENQTWNHINTQWKTKPDLFTEVKASMLFNAGIKETHPAMYTAKLKHIQNLIRGRRATRDWLCLKTRSESKRQPCQSHGLSGTRAGEPHEAGLQLPAPKGHAVAPSHARAPDGAGEDLRSEARVCEDWRKWWIW